MILDKKDVSSLAQAELETFDLKDFSLDKTIALRSLENEIVEEWNELNSPDVQKSRHNLFQIPGTFPLDYSEKILRQDNKIITFGIRHMGGNKELPFIQLRSNFSIKRREDLDPFLREILENLSAFKPLYFSFWSPKKIDADFMGSVYLVGTPQEIKSLPQWNQERDLKLVPVSDDSYYSWYQSGYDEFHREHPELKSKVTVNSKDLMKVSLDQGFLSEVFFNNKKIGLIAGEKVPLLGHQGIYFNEIFIDKDWKGKGLAKAIQRKFIATLNLENIDFVWGTIDSSNAPSYRTAISNHRKPIRYECFVKTSLNGP